LQSHATARADRAVPVQHNCESIGRQPAREGLNVGQRNTAIFLDYVRKNHRTSWKPTPVLPASNKQRGFLDRGVLLLIAYYQEGFDHRRSDDVRKVRGWMREEFSSEMVEPGGKVHLVPKAMKGRNAWQTFL
jgi:hypothetical protein